MADIADAKDAWLITRAVVRGNGHVKQGTPCQDDCEVMLSRDGSWLVAAVCDGAGSARRSDEGAKVVAETVTRGLFAEIATIEAKGPGGWLRDRVHACVLEARQKLRGRGDNLRDFHCTLVGVLVGPTGGFFFHVGDGAAVASRAVMREEREGDASQPKLFLWDSLTVSPPENGEVANETFFVTLDDWDRHLRSTSVPADSDIVMLMSDGGMEFVLPRLEINPSWITPVVGQLLRIEDDDERSQLVQGYLADPQAAPVTSDDKTLFVAIRRRAMSYASQPLSKAAPAQIERASATDPAPESEGGGGAPQSLRTRIADSHEPTSFGRLSLMPEPELPRRDLRPTIALVLSAFAVLLSLFAVILGLWGRAAPDGGKVTPSPKPPLPIENVAPTPPALPATSPPRPTIPFSPAPVAPDPSAADKADPGERR